MRAAVLIALSALLILAGPTVAQDDAPAPEQRKGPDRPAPRLLFVIDVSGSMQDLKLDESIRQAIDLAFVPTDDIEVGVIVFDSTHRRVDGPSGPGSFWYRLPSAPAAARLREAMTSLKAKGGTNPASAMTDAFSLHPQTIVLITDGGFDPIPLLAAIGDARDEVEKQGRPQPMLGIIGVGASKVQLQNLKLIQEETEAALHTVDPPAPPTPPPATEGPPAPIPAPTPPPLPEPTPIVPAPGHRVPPIGPVPPPDH